MFHSEPNWTKLGCLDETQLYFRHRFYTQHILESAPLALWELRINKYGTAKSEKQETSADGNDSAWHKPEPGAMCPTAKEQVNRAQVQLLRWDQAAKQIGKLRLQNSFIK